MFSVCVSWEKEEKIYLLASVVAFLLFLFCVLFFSVEAPVADDPHIVVGATASFFTVDDWLDKFYALSAQHAEHRLLTTRLYSLVSIGLFGFLSIQFLLALGVVILFLIAWFLYMDMKRTGVARPSDLLFFSLMLLCPAYWASVSSGWGTSNFGSILFPLLAVISMSRKSLWGFIGFEFFMVLAIFTQTNGWYVAPLGFLMLLLNKPDKYKRMLFIHFLLCLFLFNVYFSRYNFYNEIRQLITDKLIEDPLIFVANYLSWIINWLGQWVIPVGGFEYSWLSLAMKISSACGAVMLVGAIVFIYKHFFCILNNFQNQLWLLLLVISSIILGSFNRSLLPSKFALSDRYTFYSLCAIVLIYSLVISVLRYQRLQERGNLSDSWQRFVPVIFAAVYSVLIYTLSYGDLWEHKNRHLECIAMWEKEKIAKPCCWHGDMGNDMKMAESIGVMKLAPGILAN